MNRSKLPIVFLILAALITLSAILFLIFRPGVGKSAGVSAPVPAPVPKLENLPPLPRTQAGEKPFSDPADPSAALENPGPGAAAATAATLARDIAAALELGDPAKLARLIGKPALDEEAARRLKALLATPLALKQPGGIREVGESELNVRSRWVFTLADRPPASERIVLDLIRRNGKWAVENITLPPAEGDAPAARMIDSLETSDAFLQAVLSQNFEFAKGFVAAESVSDAKIAGLCILFEEGGYKLREAKPLRAMFQRDNIHGYLANVETQDRKQTAQFSLSLAKTTRTAAAWKITEINLDQLLADYASRVAGGDVYFSPLVKNPAGGDTLALYFDFDEAGVSPRTQRQLEIVSAMLKADAGKKITISGHTDSLGSEGYNKQLSENRAETVREHLIKAGVPAAQIVTLAKGASQPRRPNITESGEDDPSGRRANRRTEIYLDF